MAVKHVPLGEGTINDHEARLEKLEQFMQASIVTSTMMESAVPSLETPKKKKDKET